ncbi:Cys-tRNA(Pro) deacylase [Enorma phocaeensis]|uniref:Cys-tRNA(Pro)/Cys-tRNA(Cys) deacylase n=1 Tax=Enorma phocaeensis TaxID=1871019 RepID=A0ABT7V9L6_9ACTN|nr:Cys-tRNA(Pro) deacylase [Enorma phocaeensis]MBM6953344.1 Cys-tRNA(Pro) deacylase [Enorma phocaeensis]MDM8275196.1 Cys-tRNA(Pro) deacylase [Enorma phocaeensis]
MGAKDVKKTNAMRELERAGVAYTEHVYEVDEDDLSGVHVCEQLGEDPSAVFKTLVCSTASGGHAVCCIPVAEELDLKAAARILGEKSLAMVHVRDLVGLTGYIRGGCSPIGMKKRFPTVVDETCVLFDTVCVSGGRRGLQVELSPDDLVKVTGAKVAAITRG